jgi:hypothetical protein
MAAFPDIHVVRTQAASAPFQALLNGDRAPRPVLAARRIIAPPVPGIPVPRTSTLYRADDARAALPRP